MPAAIYEYDCGFLIRLIQGLAGYDESLYREWLLDHPDENPPSVDRDATPMLSYHRYSQDTSLLLGIYNHVGSLTCGLLETEDGKHPEFTPIMPPGASEPKQTGKADFKSMQAFLPSYQTK